jgi:hypothetical protein
MIARLRERAREAVEVARLLPVLPHLIRTSGDLEQRIMTLEADRAALETELGQLGSIMRELYVGPAPAEAEVPDA